MEENPYKAPGEKGVEPARLTGRSRFHLMLFLTLGSLIGLAFAAMMALDLDWQFKALIWAGIIIGVFAGYRIGPPQTVDRAGQWKPPWMLMVFFIVLLAIPFVLAAIWVGINVPDEW